MPVRKDVPASELSGKIDERHPFQPAAGIVIQQPDLEIAVGIEQSDLDQAPQVEQPDLQTRIPGGIIEKAGLESVILIRQIAWRRSQKKVVLADVRQCARLQEEIVAEHIDRCKRNRPRLLQQSQQSQCGKTMAVPVEHLGMIQKSDPQLQRRERHPGDESLAFFRVHDDRKMGGQRQAAEQERSQEEPFHLPVPFREYPAGFLSERSMQISFLR